MTRAVSAGAAGGARPAGEEAGAVAGIARWLCLAATPTFALMALLTGVLDGGRMEAICSAGEDAPLSGMVLMYLLMSAFHVAPWLQLMSGRRGSARRS